MTVWEELLRRHRKGKQLLVCLQKTGPFSDTDVAALDLLDLMHRQNLMCTKADRAVFQDLEEALTDVRRGTVWHLTAGARNYTSPSPAHALQRLALDLLMDCPSEIRALYDVPCPYTGKVVLTSSSGTLAGPETGIWLDAKMSRSEAFAAAEWLCRACGMHASLHCIERRRKAETMQQAEQLCMPGMEEMPGADPVQEEPEPEWKEEEGVLPNAVQLGMPVFQTADAPEGWVEVPIEASLTEAPDATTAGELAALLLGNSHRSLTEERNLPMQGVQLSFLDIAKQG